MIVVPVDESVVEGLKRIVKRGEESTMNRDTMDGGGEVCI